MKIVGSILFVFLLSLASCSRSEKSGVNMNHRQLKIDPIVRLSDEKVFEIGPLEKKPRDSYFFEPLALPRITKEFFRCKGSRDHAPKLIHDKSEEAKMLYDCSGIESHGLPVRQEEEYICPILLELLNKVQETLSKKVVVTSGHRCPMHASYLDSEMKLPKPRHMMGAGVDFYVQDYEYQPEVALECIKGYYKEDSDPKFREFIKSSSINNCWSNKEISLTIYAKNQGRDLDNKHSYPYISIEVKFDRELQKPLDPTWKLTHESYLRW